MLPQHLALGFSLQVPTPLQPSCSGFDLIFLNFYTHLFMIVLGLHCAGFSLVAASGGYSPAVVHRLLTAVVFLLGSTGSRRVGFALAIPAL